MNPYCCRVTSIKIPLANKNPLTENIPIASQNVTLLSETYRSRNPNTRTRTPASLRNSPSISRMLLRSSAGNSGTVNVSAGTRRCSYQIHAGGITPSRIGPPSASTVRWQGAADPGPTARGDHRTCAVCREGLPPGHPKGLLRARRALGSPPWGQPCLTPHAWASTRRPGG